MTDPHPTFPPLLTGHAVAAELDPATAAASRLAEGVLGAGDLIWSLDDDTLRFALVLEPDVPRSRCPEMVFVAMVAVGDAIGAVSPPEVSVTYQWPSIIRVNGAEAGFVDLLISEHDTEGVPDWMILSVWLNIRPPVGGPEPGSNLDRTTLWDEGCGVIGRNALLESVSRHLVNVIHSWSEDGFRTIHEQWWPRLSAERPFPSSVAPEAGETVPLLGLDESGNALMKTNSTTNALMTVNALERLRTQRRVSS